MSETLLDVDAGLHAVSDRAHEMFGAEIIDTFSQSTPRAREVDFTVVRKDGAT